MDGAEVTASAAETVCDVAVGATTLGILLLRRGSLLLRTHGPESRKFPTIAVFAPFDMTQTTATKRDKSPKLPFEYNFAEIIGSTILR
jgi:hypothetical protein